MGDVTARVLMIFAHPNHTKDKPNSIAVRLVDFIQYGPPATKKGKYYYLLKTYFTQ